MSFSIFALQAAQKPVSFSDSLSFFPHSKQQVVVVFCIAYYRFYPRYSSNLSLISVNINGLRITS